MQILPIQMTILGDSHVGTHALASRVDNGLGFGMWGGKALILSPSKAGARGLSVRATQMDAGNKRLVDVVRRLPRIGRAYFRSPFRRALFGGIALFGGFYVAQTISLSFGALGVNDVIAAAMCVLFTEYITRFCRTRKKITFPVALVNNFKMGFTYGLFIDAFKLASLMENRGF